MRWDFTLNQSPSATLYAESLFLFPFTTSAAESIYNDLFMLLKHKKALKAAPFVGVLPERTTLKSPPSWVKRSPCLVCQTVGHGIKGEGGGGLFL